MENEVIQVQSDSAFLETFVDAHSNEVLSVTDFVNDFTYRVVPITKQAPPDGFETLVDPEDLTASPDGWVAANQTAGPNAISYISKQTATSSASGTGEFIYNWSNTTAPSTTVNQNAARVNAFYIVNTIHDFAKRYGFTPETFNFENEDRILVSVQDPSGTNNAQFSSESPVFQYSFVKSSYHCVAPPDGQSGEAQMYIFTITNVSFPFDLS